MFCDTLSTELQGILCHTEGLKISFGYVVTFCSYRIKVLGLELQSGQSVSLYWRQVWLCELLFYKQPALRYSRFNDKIGSKV